MARNQLIIAQEAKKRNDYSWEINHTFPYNDSLFVEYYERFMQHIENKDDKQAAEFRKRLKNLINYIDFEYLTWIEWKEGFARLIENKIRPQLGINDPVDLLIFLKSQINMLIYFS